MAARIKRDQDQEKGTSNKSEISSWRTKTVRYATARLGFPGRSYGKLKSQSVKTGG